MFTFRDQTPLKKARIGADANIATMDGQGLRSEPENAATMIPGPRPCALEVPIMHCGSPGRDAMSETAFVVTG